MRSCSSANKRSSSRSRERTIRERQSRRRLASAAVGPRADRGCLGGVDLTGRVALVTGASRGIGADTARMLAREGARVVCCARTAHDGEHPLEGSLDGTVAAIRAEGGEATAVQANLARDEDCERVVDAAGPVDILINNAAVAFFGKTVDLPVSRWTVSWRVTVHATFLLSKLVLPGMIERGWGRAEPAPLTSACSGAVATPRASCAPSMPSRPTMPTSTPGLAATVATSEMKLSTGK